LQTFYSHLQAHALGEEPEMVSDYLLPDYEGLAKIEPLIENFKEKVYSDYACLVEKNGTGSEGKIFLEQAFDIFFSMEFWLRICRP
jgi:hypothetical protein